MLSSFLLIGIGWAQRRTAKPCRGIVHPGKQTVECSGSQPLVAMMQTADLWKRHDLSGAAGLNRSPLRGVLAQRKMGSGSVVVIQVRNKDLPQVAFIENDDVIEALPPASASRAAAQPITRSTKGFCHGERGAVTTSSMSKASILALTIVRYALSRSWMR